MWLWISNLCHSLFLSNPQPSKPHPSKPQPSKHQPNVTLALWLLRMLWVTLRNLGMTNSIFRLLEKTLVTRAKRPWASASLLLMMPSLHLKDKRRRNARWCTHLVGTSSMRRLGEISLAQCTLCMRLWMHHLQVLPQNQELWCSNVWTATIPNDPPICLRKTLIPCASS